MENKNKLLEASVQELQDALQVLAFISAIDNNKVVTTEISISLNGCIILEMRDKDYHLSFKIKVQNDKWYLLHNDFIVELTPSQIEIIKNEIYEKGYIYYSLIKEKNDNK